MRTALALFAIATIIQPGANAQSFEGLGDLPGGSTFSHPTGVSDDGTVVVGTSFSANGQEAFRWTAADGMEGLGSLSSVKFLSSASGVSGDGRVVVGVSYDADVAREAFRWAEGVGMEGLGRPLDGESIATGASDNGSVIVGWVEEDDRPVEAVRWPGGGGMQRLGTLPGGSTSTAFAVSSGGDYVVGVGGYASGDAEAFRWSFATGTLRGLGDLPGGAFFSIAADVSDDGAVVVGAGTGATRGEAFRWTEGGGMQGLGFLRGSDQSGATGVSGDGRVVVGNSFFATRTRPLRLGGTDRRGVVGNEGGRPFIWTVEDGMRSLRDILETDLGLDLGDWDLGNATGISSDGSTIVGVGVNPSGIVEAWRAVLLPTARWLDPLSGFYNEPTRWSLNGVPTSQHAVLFNVSAAAPYMVTFVQDQTARSVVVDSADVELDLGGATFTLGLTAPPPALVVGSVPTAAAAFALSGGTLDAHSAVVGRPPGSSGLLEVGAGTPATLDLDGVLTVGAGGMGSVDATQSGSVVTLRQGLHLGDAAGSSGGLNLGGGALLQVTEGSRSTYIGRAGVGTLTVGGTLSLVGPTVIGDVPSGYGTLTLASGASGATQDTLWVGRAGTGGVEVLSGSSLTSTVAVMGREAGALGTALVDGPGSRWDVSDTVELGVSGSGLITITNGGTVDAAAIDVGPSGTASLVDGTLCIGGSCRVARRPGDVNALNTLSLSLAEGATVEAGSASLRSGGLLEGDGALDLPLANAGVLAPGGEGAAGRFTLGADYAQDADGILEIELGGPGPGTDHDQLVVTGAAALGGTLRVRLLDGYAPAPGTRLTVVTAASVSGAFDALDLADGLDAAVVVEGGDVLLAVGAGTAGEPAGPGVALALDAPTPNPTPGPADVRFTVPEAGPVRLTVSDALGREVAVLLDRVLPAGPHAVRLEAGRLPAGVYLVRLGAGPEVAARTLTVAR